MHSYKSLYNLKPDKKFIYNYMQSYKFLYNLKPAHRHSRFDNDIIEVGSLRW